MQLKEFGVSLGDLIHEFNFEVVYGPEGFEKIEITKDDVNRPGLQLAGFFDYFDHHRVQIIGHVENTYMEKQGLEYSVEMMGRIMSYKVPCIVYCRDMAVPDAILEVADKAGHNYHKPGSYNRNRNYRETVSMDVKTLAEEESADL